MNRTWIIVGVLLVALAAPGRAAEPVDPVILPGDELLLDLASHPDLGGTYVVDVRGFIAIDPLGPCSLLGLTPADAATALADSLAAFYRGVRGVEVRILRRQLAVRVEGMVTQPGDYFLPYYAGLEEAIAAAGGIRQGGLLTRVLVEGRGGRSEVDLRRYRITGERELLPSLLSGDRIFVPVSNREAPIVASLAPLELPFEDPNVIHVIGAVPRGGTHQMPGEVSLLEALALGGGPGHGADVRHIQVIPGEGQPYRVDLTKLAALPADQQPRISAGATVLVPEDKPGFLEQTIKVVVPIVISAYLIRDF